MPTDANPADQPPTKPAARVKLRDASRPGIAVWIIAGLCAIGLVWVRYKAESFDHAFANIIALILAFIAATAFLVWFVFRSSYAGLLRLLTGLAWLGFLIVPALCFKGVDANLVPRFGLPGAKTTDQQLDPLGTMAAVGVDLQTTTDADFPQFLGPHRDGTVGGITLARDWSARPPKLLWKQPIGAGWSAFAAVNGFAVTMEQRGDDELTTCYDIETGALMWSHSIQARHEHPLGGIGPRSTPTIHEGQVYALGATGVLRCLDGATGNQRWTFDVMPAVGTTPDNDQDVVMWGRSGSPLLVDDLVVVPGGGPKGGPCVSLIALHKDDGTVAWKGGKTQIAYASPSVVTLGGVRQIISVNETTVSGHDIPTGRELWSQAWPGRSAAEANNSQAHAIDDARVFVSKGYPGGGSLLFEVKPSGTAWQTEIVYRNKKSMRTKLTNVVLHQGSVYGLSDGILECIDLESGERRWKKGRFSHGQILRVGDLLLVLAETGELSLVEANPEQFVELGKLPVIQGTTWNNLCLYGHRLLVRNGEEAACLELP